MIEDTQPTLPQPTEPPQELVNASVSPTEPVSPIPTPESSTESTPEPQAEEINEQGTMSKPQEAIENIQPTEPQEQPPQPPEPQPSAFQPAPTEQASQIEKPPEDTPRPAGNTEPTNQETQERIIEKTIVRELTEDEKAALYKTRLKTGSYAILLEQCAFIPPFIKGVASPRAGGFSLCAKRINPSPYGYSL